MRETGLSWLPLAFTPCRVSFFGAHILFKLYFVKPYGITPSTVKPYRISLYPDSVYKAVDSTLRQLPELT